MVCFRLLFVTASFLLFVQCQNNVNSSTGANQIRLADTDTSAIISPLAFAKIDTIFDRTIIKARLKAKIEIKAPLIVHVFVPLCDNDHQGIVPTTKSLGNGLSLRTNLYWATSGGTKGYFKNQPDWKTVYNAFNIDSNVLERIVFKHDYQAATVYVIADAYRGDRMEETVNDYLAAISNNKQDSVLLKNGLQLHIAGRADLIMFNGHNGAMDAINIKPWQNTSDKRTDIVMNSCLSYNYLQTEFMQAGGYPLVRTKTLLYPGAYVLKQIIDDWVAATDETQLCLNAGRIYCQKHNCGKGTKVFKTGW